MIITRSTSLELVGKGNVTVKPADHVATGGEGEIYRCGQTIIKLYSHLARAKRANTFGKIEQLAKLSHPFVVSPRGIVNDKTGQALGFYMNVAPGEPLPRVFTSDWRRRNAFGDRATSLLASRMHEVVEFAHSNGAIMVDANEFNWTADASRLDDPTPRNLDVDSWSIGPWPGQAIMPSIRDWQTQGFTTSSDWFGWGVVTFQLYTGIHPYKGRLDGYKPAELERRMRENASVFNPEIRLNHAVRDFNSIPGPLLDWYRRTFENGERSIPPSPLTNGKTTIKPNVARIVIRASGNVRYDRLFDGTLDPFVRIYECGVCLSASGVLRELGSGRRIGGGFSANCEVIRTTQGWLAAELQGDRIIATLISDSMTTESVTASLECSQLLRSGNRLFGVTLQGLTELRLMQFSRPILATGQTWGALPYATSWFDGVGIQNTLGATHLILPFRDDGCVQIRVPELDGLRYVAARAGNKFVIVMTINRQGQYERFELSLDRMYRTYQITRSRVDAPEINTAILNRGVTASIDDDGELVILVPSSSQRKIIRDKDANTKTVLFAWDDRVIGIRNGSVWRIQAS
jgi:hypothetical protein